MLGGTTRKLSLDDAVAVSRLPVTVAAMPISFGQARVEARSRGRGRSVLIYGVTADLPRVWNYQIQQGTFWPSRDPFRAAPYAVLGPKLARELFDSDGALGEFVHIDGRRFRVLGVMEPKGPARHRPGRHHLHSGGLGDADLQRRRGDRDRRQLRGQFHLEAGRGAGAAAA